MLAAKRGRQRGDEASARTQVPVLDLIRVLDLILVLAWF